MNIYKDVMDFEANAINVTTFAVAIDKTALQQFSDARLPAWTFALQRINTFCSRNGDRAMIIPDEGHGLFIRKLLRRIRRWQAIHGYYGGTMNIPTRLIVEDPYNKNSAESYITQMADWNAYAAHRSRYVDPKRKTRSDLWDHLAPVLLLEVNALRGGPPGIVLWP